MPLILLKTEKKCNIWNFYIEKVYFNMKKLFSTKCVLTSKKVKNGYFVQFQRKEMYKVFICFFFNQNIEINKKLSKKVTIGLKSYFFS